MFTLQPTLFDPERLARQAGEILRLGYEQEHQVDYKGAIDLVTEVDHQSEQLLLGEIQRLFPGHRIISEEIGLACPGAERLHRQPDGGGRADMAEEDDPGVLRDALPELLQHFFSGVGGQRNGLVNQSCASFLADEFSGVITATVILVGGEDFIPRAL